MVKQGVETGGVPQGALEINPNNFMRSILSTLGIENPAAQPSKRRVGQEYVYVADYENEFGGRSIKVHRYPIDRVRSQLTIIKFAIGQISNSASVTKINGDEMEVRDDFQGAVNGISVFLTEAQADLAAVAASA